MIRPIPSVLAVLLLSAVPMAARAQAPATDLVGTISDRAGRPVANASVSAVEVHRAVVSGADGRFNLGALAAGEYTVLVRKLGYAPAGLTVRLPLTTAPLAITLADVAQRIEPVNVTAARAAVDPSRSPLATSALSGDEIHRRSGISLAQSLSSVAEVRNVSTGLHIGKPMVRGLFGPRVLVAQDGSRLEDYSWSEEDGPSVDARLADRVEIIRGPASVLYGADALGGVVNVVPAELPYAPDGTRYTRGLLEGYFGSNSLELGSAARLEGARGSLGWRLFGTGRVAQSYHTPDGEVENTGFLSANVDGAVATRAANRSTTLRFSHYGGEFKLLEANGPTPAPGVEEEGPERKLLDDRVQVADMRRLGFGRLETRAQFQRHSLIEVSDDCIPTPPATTCTPVPGQEKPAFDLLLNTGTVDVMLHHSAFTDAAGVARMSGTSGISAMRQSNDSRGPIFLVPSASIWSVGAFGFEQFSLGRVTVSGGARIDYRKQASDSNTQLLLSSDERAFGMVTGSLGAVLSLTRSVSAVVNGGTGWRAPTLFDLYSNGPHLAEARFERGDPSMQAEFGRDLDVGLRYGAGRGRAEITGFQNSIDNFIYTRRATNGAVIAGLPVYEHVQSDARIRGLEVSGEVAVTSSVTARARHEMLEGDNIEDGGYLPMMAPARSVLGAEWLVGRGSSFAGIRLGAEVEHVADQNRLGPGDVATGSYTLFNLEAETERMLLPGWNREIRLSLDARNVTNVAYRNFLSRYKAFANDPGINLVLRLSTEW